MLQKKEKLKDVKAVEITHEVVDGVYKETLHIDVESTYLSQLKEFGLIGTLDEKADYIGHASTIENHTTSGLTCTKKE